MSETARLSRRALFTLGIARAVGDLAPDPPPERRAPPAPAVDRDAWAARQRAAGRRCGERELWTPAVAPLLAAAGPLDGMRLLAAGATAGVLATAAALRGANSTMCHDDLAALPFADASFDCAVSAFAPMFCLDARGAVAELFRVVRPGGAVAFTAWRRGGIVGALLRLACEHDPPPQGIPAPLAWGREERLRQDLELVSDDAVFEQRAIELSFGGREQAVDELCGALQPLAAVAMSVPLRAAAMECVDAHTEGDGTPLHLRAPYVLARAIRRTP